MTEITRYGGGGDDSQPQQNEDEIDRQMRAEMNQAQSDYQLAWIKNMNGRIP